LKVFQPKLPGFFLVRNDLSFNILQQKKYFQVYINKRTCFQLIGRRATDPGGGAAETRTGASKGDPGQGEETVRGAEEEVPNGSADGTVKRRLVRVIKKWIVELGDGDSNGEGMHYAVTSPCRGLVVRASVRRNTAFVLTIFLHTRG
jgi:hypothetical protein